MSEESREALRKKHRNSDGTVVTDSLEKTRSLMNKHQSDIQYKAERRQEYRERCIGKLSGKIYSFADERYRENYDRIFNKDKAEDLPEPVRK